MPHFNFSISLGFSPHNRIHLKQELQVSIFEQNLDFEYVLFKNLKNYQSLKAGIFT